MLNPIFLTNHLAWSDKDIICCLLRGVGLTKKVVAKRWQFHCNYSPFLLSSFLWRDLPKTSGPHFVNKAGILWRGKLTPLLKRPRLWHPFCSSCSRGTVVMLNGFLANPTVFLFDAVCCICANEGSTNIHRKPPYILKGEKKGFLILNFAGLWRYFWRGCQNHHHHHHQPLMALTYQHMRTGTYNTWHTHTWLLRYTYC